MSGPLAGRHGAAGQIRSIRLGIDETDLSHPVAVQVLLVDLQFGSLDDFSVDAADAGWGCHPVGNLKTLATNVVQAKAVDLHPASLVLLSATHAWS
jgi:hypothetical protein